MMLILDVNKINEFVDEILVFWFCFDILLYPSFTINDGRMIPV